MQQHNNSNSYNRNAGDSIMKRRPFLKIAGGLLGSCAFGIHPSFAALKSSDEIVDTVNGIHRCWDARGKVSIVGFPVWQWCTASSRMQRISQAVRMGSTIYVAPAYGNGDAETTEMP